jgi:outer membrane protein assembly factor BamB
MPKMPVISFILFLWIGVFNIGCKKDPLSANPGSPIPSVDTKLQVLWKQPLAPDTTNGKSSMTPIIIGNKVIFSTRYFNPGAEILDAYNTVTGQRVWEWTNYLHPISAFSDIKSTSDKLVVCTGIEVDVIDANTGQTVWATQRQYGSPRIAVIGDFVYHSFGTKNIGDTVCYLVRSPLDHPQWDTVYIAKIKNGYSPSFESMALWINQQGDSVLAFQNRQCNFSTTTNNQIDFIAYNLTKKKEEFSIIDIDKDHNSSVGSVTVFQNKMYFLGIGTVYCIDPLTGTVVWSKAFNGFGENFGGDDLHVIMGSLIVKPGGNSIYRLDPSTGNVVWKTDNVSGGGASLMCKNGIIYFLCGHMNAVSFSSGNLLWDKKSPNQYSPNRYYGVFLGRSGIAIDPATSNLYTSDDRWAMCIKLPN